MILASKVNLYSPQIERVMTDQLRNPIQIQFSETLSLLRFLCSCTVDLRSPAPSIGDDSPNSCRSSPSLTTWRQLSTNPLEPPSPPQKLFITYRSSGWWWLCILWTSLRVSWLSLLLHQNCATGHCVSYATTVTHNGFQVLLVSNTLSQAFNYTYPRAYMPGTNSYWCNQ